MSTDVPTDALLLLVDEIRLLRVESWEQDNRDHIASRLERHVGQYAEVTRTGDELSDSVGKFLVAWRQGVWGSRLNEHLARMQHALKSWRSEQ